MTWIKISDAEGGIYAETPDPDPRQIKSIADIETEIATLEAERYEGNDARILAWVKEHWYSLEIGQRDSQIQGEIERLRWLIEERKKCQ